MEETARKTLKHVERLEKELALILNRKDPAYANIEPHLTKLRVACQDFIFTDISGAASEKIESRLWDCHARVNQKFRAFLAQFKDDQGKKKHVERRKAEKLYIDFLKSSQRFYRGYIQRLASHFTGVPEVLEVARKFNLDTLTADHPINVDNLLKKQIIRSCYSSLVQLGDLSRYRETEVPKKERNWGPAKGYYDLATALDPTWGTSYNQLAVIALTDQDHLRAVYYLYRAISVENPFPQAPGNLEIEFKKIRNRAVQGKPISSTNLDGPNSLSDRFLVFHASCAESSFVSNDVHLDEIFRQLADDLREKPSDSRIRKLCLINIAAEEVAAQKIRDGGTDIQPFRNLQQLNVGTFFLLLKLLLDELQNVVKRTDQNPETTTASVEVTAVTRRILPHLRTYSGWLMSTVDLLLASLELKVQMRELWQVYAEALSTLVAIYPIVTIAELPYLLTEDADVFGFTPFIDFVGSQRFFDAQGSRKSSHDEKIQGPRSVDDEMLYRIKGLVRDGIFLCRKPDEFGSQPIPLTFAENRFMFLDDSAVHDQSTISAMHINADSVHSISREDIEAARSSRGEPQHVQHHADEVSDAGVTGSVTSTMENMVNNLTHQESSQQFPRSTTLTDIPLTPTLRTPTAGSFAERSLAPSQSLTFTARDLVQQIQRGSNVSLASPEVLTNRPSLPSILNSPFAPLPGETPGSSPRPSAAQFQTPYSTSTQAQFRLNIAQQEQQLQNRSSPGELPLPTMSSHFTETPTHLTSWVRGTEQSQPLTSPFLGQSFSPLVQGEIIPSRPPQRASFGAVGESRPRSSGAPTSGQPD